MLVLKVSSCLHINENCTLQTSSFTLRKNEIGIHHVYLILQNEQVMLVYFEIKSYIRIGTILAIFDVKIQTF